MDDAGGAEGLERRTLVVEGVERTYLVAGADRSGGVVVCLHGSRSTAARQARLSGLGALRSVGLVVVFPQALVPAGRGYQWDHERDLPALAAVIAAVRDRVEAPGPAVFLAGMSGGARMACHYAAARAEEVAALAAVAGLRAPQTPPARAVRVVAFHGLVDRINPYVGGRGARWRESVPEAARSWAAANGVEQAKEVDDLSPTLTRTSYGAATPAEVTLWTSRDAGHTWPGHPGGVLLRLLLGKTSSELDATEEIARFYGALPAEAPEARA